MMTSAVACSICWIVITIAAAMIAMGKGNSYQLGIVAVSAFFFFFASFGMGVLGVPWLYPTEINALEMRAKGSSLAMATNWIMNYMVAQVTPSGIANLGWRFWMIWAILCASFVPITYLFYPETANRTLEDIDRYFATHPSIFVFRDKLATQLKRPAAYEKEDEKIAEAAGGKEDVLGKDLSEKQMDSQHVEV